MGCRALFALLVLHRAKLLASNQSVLALGVAPSGVRAAAPHSARHGRRACMPKGSARCRANQAYTAFHRGEGVWGFGKDAEIRTRRALHEAKPSECPKGDRGSELEVCFKNILFLQTESHSKSCGFQLYTPKFKSDNAVITKAPPP